MNLQRVWRWFIYVFAVLGLVFISLILWSFYDPWFGKTAEYWAMRGQSYALDYLEDEALKHGDLEAYTYWNDYRKHREDIR